MSDPWSIVVTDNGPDATRPPHETFRFVARAKNAQTGEIVYGRGDSEREARQDAYIQIEQARKEQSGRVTA